MNQKLKDIDDECLKLGVPLYSHVLRVLSRVVEHVASPMHPALWEEVEDLQDLLVEEKP